MNVCPYDLIVGLERADKKADLCLLDVRTGQRRSGPINTAPEALWEWLLALRQQYPAARVGLCLEQPAGHLISFLEASAWVTLHPINPLTLQKYREALVTSRAKDDAKDAEYLADLLRHHHAQLPVWAPEDSATRAVQQRVFHRRAVVDERPALSNRLLALLKQYFPQALTLCGADLWRPLATAFLRKWPSLGASLGSQRERFGSSAAQLQCYTGIAPVTKRSGGSCRIHRRYLCPKFHRQSFHEYAKESILWSRWAGAYYLQQRQKGSSHHTAVRALAFKWQRIIWRCWQDRRPYDEATYEAALRKRPSPVVALLDRVELGKSPWKNPAQKN